MKPAAWVRNLTDPQPHCVTDLTYMSAADTDAGVQYVPLYADEPEADVCCQDFRNCLRSCTPRGQWIAHVRCGCGDQIMPDDGAECGTCVTARNAVKSEWQGLTEEEIKHLWYEACQTNLELTSQLIVHLARNIEAKLKEMNT